MNGQQSGIATMGEGMLEAKYGLPPEVTFCKRCVMSNQRPASAMEFEHNADSRKVTMHIDTEGICDACRHAEHKERIDWKAREEGVALIKRFDCEFPDRYFDEIMEYLGMTPERFHELAEKARSPHLWQKADGEWKLRNAVWME